jgi:hypothetical protein
VSALKEKCNWQPHQKKAVTQKAAAVPTYPVVHKAAVKDHIELAAVEIVATNRKQVYIQLTTGRM